MRIPNVTPCWDEAGSWRCHDVQIRRWLLHWKALSEISKADDAGVEKMPPFWLLCSRHCCCQLAAYTVLSSFASPERPCMTELHFRIHEGRQPQIFIPFRACMCPSDLLNRILPGLPLAAVTWWLTFLFPFLLPV